MNWRVSVNDEIIIISSDEEDLVFVVTPMKRFVQRHRSQMMSVTNSACVFEPLPESMSCRKK